MSAGRQGTNVRERALSIDNDEIVQRISASFEKQGLMRTIGATLGSVRPGQVEIILTPHAGVSQQYGFVHGGALGTIADSAVGFSAMSLMPSDRGVLTTECNMNFLAPAEGDRIIARGKVVKTGRTLTFCQCELFAKRDDQEQLIALFTATLIAVDGRDGISD